MRFEWDENKNASHKVKHNVSFEEAASVFDDPNSLEQGSIVKGERRIIRVGKTATKTNTIGRLHIQGRGNQHYIRPPGQQAGEKCVY